MIPDQTRFYRYIAFPQNTFTDSLNKYEAAAVSVDRKYIYDRTSWGDNEYVHVYYDNKI